MNNRSHRYLHRAADWLLN